jgi:hypothetical protein
MRKLINELGGRKFLAGVLAGLGGTAAVAIEQFASGAVSTGSIKGGIAALIVFIIMEGAADIKSRAKNSDSDIAKQVIDELEKRAEGK